MKANQILQADGGQAVYGDHLLTPRNGYWHHGIYVGRGRVVHYARCHEELQPRTVIEVSLTQFEAGNGYCVARSATGPLAALQIVARARSRIGEHQYHLLRNNCEHFCNWCTCGCAVSEQVSRIKAVLARSICLVGITSLAGGCSALI